MIIKELFGKKKRSITNDLNILGGAVIQRRLEINTDDGAGLLERGVIA